MHGRRFVPPGARVVGKVNLNELAFGAPGIIEPGFRVDAAADPARRDLISSLVLASLADGEAVTPAVMAAALREADLLVLPTVPFFARLLEAPMRTGHGGLLLATGAMIEQRSEPVQLHSQLAPDSCDTERIAPSRALGIC